MNERIIDELRNAYQIKPNKKDEFISNIRNNDMSTFKFILLQSKYMHANTLLKNVLLIIAMILICIKADVEDALLFISAGIPLIALVMVYELEQSNLHRMAELEQATRFSLKMLVLSRLLISGIMSLISVSLITLVTYKTKQTELLKIVVSFFLPYCLTLYSCMRILRKYRDVGTKYCFVCAAIISISFIVISNMPLLLNLMYKTNISISLLIICVLMICLESKKYLVDMEDYLWN